MRTIFYLDNINFSSIWSYFFQNKTKNLIVLDHIKLNVFTSFFIKITNLTIKEADFIAGYLLDKKGESVYLSSRKITSRLAIKAANNIINNNKELCNLNLNYGNNTIKLFISKYLTNKIEYFVTRCLIVRTINEKSDKKITLYIKNTDVFSSDLIDEEFSDINIIYYSTYLDKYFDLFKYFLLIILRQVRLVIQYLTTNHQLSKFNLDKQSVLSFSEDTIRNDKKLRSHLYWLNNDKTSPNYNNYVIESNNSAKDYVRLPDSGTIIISLSLAIKAIKKCSKNKHIKDLEKQINLLFWKFIFEPNYINKNYYVLIFNLFRESKKISSISIYLNSKVYLYKETHSLYSDAIQLISSKIGLKTLCVQYSNMSVMNPIMMSSADEYILFSEMYKKVFEYKDIKPKKFISFGYLYNGTDIHVKKESELIRKNLMALGVNFIVGYFDESVQFDKWAFFTKEAHLHELHQLAKKVINDPTFAVIVKSQFIYSIPSKLYSKDKIIQDAKSTGRFIELSKGGLRNDIYPTQVALSSDLCISHKVGATAGLESALLGKKTLLLNSPPSFGFLDNLYQKSNILYSSIDEVIIAINSYRRGDLNKQELGDWKDIIHNFDSYIDNKAVIRLREHIEKSFINT
jgi:hypothetical protein